jgi:hypothetical protein
LINFAGQTGRLRRGDRLDQARIVIPDIVDARADRPQQRYANALREDRRELQEKPPLLLGDCGMSILRLCSGQSAELLAAGGDDHAALALLAAAGSLAAFCVG